MMNVEPLNRYNVKTEVEGAVSPSLVPVLVLVLVLGLVLDANGQANEPTSGYGPPTSVPPEASITKPAARPRQNWIDQSQAEADAKSAGCNQCHNGVEPMHQASHVVLGCTDCHGGN